MTDVTVSVGYCLLRPLNMTTWIGWIDSHITLIPFSKFPLQAHACIVRKMGITENSALTKSISRRAPNIYKKYST